MSGMAKKGVELSVAVDVQKTLASARNRRRLEPHDTRGDAAFKYGRFGANIVDSFIVRFVSDNDAVAGRGHGRL